MEELKRLAEKIQIYLSDEQVQKFEQYRQMMVTWNEKINLTAIVDEKEIILKHFIDSLTIVPWIPQQATIIDIGTGAGLPGIPVQIYREDCQVTLLDSLQKRVSFLQKVKETLALSSMTAVHGRAEDMANEARYREQFDVATARAVAHLAVLAEYCLPFVKVGGYFICMKGNKKEEVEEAEKAITTMGGKIKEIVNFTLPETDMERSLIIIQKIKATPKSYPRKAGVPNKKPLL